MVLTAVSSSHGGPSLRFPARQKRRSASTSSAMRVALASASVSISFTSGSVTDSERRMSVR